jgi:ABC-type uncharacterized transport system substrate-binding protein
MKRILALAVGAPMNVTISNKTQLDGVRPYIEGLIDALAGRGRPLGTDFVVDYSQAWYEDVVSGKAIKEKLSNHDLIYAMSTTVIRAAGKYAAENIPIVFPNVSDPTQEKYVSAGRATGFSAKRTQTADRCFECFFATVPTLKEVIILHKDDHDPSDHAKELVMSAAAKRGLTPTLVTIVSHQDLKDKLGKMPARDRGRPASVGIQVLPVDLFFGTAPDIIKWVQKDKLLPAFFSVSDWVKPPYSALGGFGVSQYKCGERTALPVDRILWGSLIAKDLKVVDAIDDDFEWVVSRVAADALNIPLGGISGHVI